MRKITFVSFFVLSALITFLYACNKSEKDLVESSNIKVLPITFNNPSSGNALEGCCDYSQVVYANVTFYIATCKSECEKV